MIREPRSMTAADIMVQVAGVGLGFALVPPVLRSPQSNNPGRGPTNLAMIAAVAVSAVVIARLVRYRRRARPAEWLAILTAILLGAGRPEWQLDQAINPVFGAFMRVDVSFARLRWALAGMTALIIGAGLGMLRNERGTLPPWAKTVTTAWLAFLTLWGPIDVIAINGPNLLAPPGGYGSGLGPAVYWLICQHLAWIPLGILFGIPLIAAIDSRVRHFPWVWTEWAAFATFLVALMVAATLRRGMVGSFSILGGIEKGLDITWILAVSLLARWALIRLRPAWSLLFDAPPPPQRSEETSTETSPARTA